MLHTGLVSVTFRKLSPQEIVALVAEAGLEGIEWGGDVHVPHGDQARARSVRALTEDAGLRVASYGSYYRVGHEEPVPFETVLETALSLGAPTVRVWAGKQGSASADAAYRDLVARECRRIAAMAAAEGVTVAAEFHGGTLPDTAASAVALLEAVGPTHFKSYWQPPVGMETQDALAGLRQVLPWLSHVHAFHWRDGARLPLAEGAAPWGEYLREIARAEGDRSVMLEFVRDDDPEQFRQDAATLRRWLAGGA